MSTESKQMNSLRHLKYQPKIEARKSAEVISQQFLYSIILTILLGIIALIPRLVGFGSIPPSLSWDEAAVGVNGWSIIHSGKDEWGYKLPSTFYSFGDDKNPVHIYLTSLSILGFGLNEFAVRFPVLILGVVNVILLFWVGSLMFKSKIVGSVAALSLAVSPYNIIFSHFNHELNFTIFFFLAGLLFFYLALNGRRNFLIWSFVFFAIDLLSYNSAKVIVPLIVVVLVLLHIKKLWKQRISLLIGCVVFFGFVGLIFFNPHLSGSARAGQNSFSEGEIKETEYFKKTNDVLLSRIYLSVDQYLDHFSFNYLFKSGDKNVRHSPQVFGEFYHLELLFMILGLIMLAIKRSKESIILLFWMIIAPIPSALFKESPHSARAMFMIGSMHMLIGLGVLGFVSGIIYVKNSWFQMKFNNTWIIAFIFVLITGYYFLSLSRFLNFYKSEYAERYAIDWQYGMKEIVQYVNTRSDLERVYVTDSRAQPYIFFRFYNPISTADFLKTAVLDTSEQKSSNMIERYDKYIFGRWDKIGSMPTKGILYVLTPSEYSGLLHRTDFEVKKLIKYPNDSDAFFLVEGNQ